MSQGRDQRIERLRAGYDAVPPGGPAAARAANALGRQLAVRFFEAGAPQDRDLAITLLDEALLAPHDDATVTHAALGMLLFFRAMPIPLGADPDGTAAISAVAWRRTGASGGSFAMIHRRCPSARSRSASRSGWLSAPVISAIPSAIAALGMLLFFRAMPIPLGADPDGTAS